MILRISVNPIPNNIQSQNTFLHLFRFPAPKFWLVKVTAAWANVAVISYVKYSKFNVREEPAMASSPKEFRMPASNTWDVYCLHSFSKWQNRNYR